MRVKILGIVNKTDSVFIILINNNEIIHLFNWYLEPKAIKSPSNLLANILNKPFMTAFRTILRTFVSMTTWTYPKRTQRRIKASVQLNDVMIFRLTKTWTLVPMRTWRHAIMHWSDAFCPNWALFWAEIVSPVRNMLFWSSSSYNNLKTENV